MSDVFDLTAHFQACRAADAAVTSIHALDGDTFLVERQGEVSLASREIVVAMIKRMSRGETVELGGGDVGRAERDVH